MNIFFTKTEQNNLKADLDTDAEFLKDAIDISIVSGLTVEPQACKQLLESIYGRAKRLMLKAQKYAEDEQRQDITLADWRKVQRLLPKKSKLLSITEKSDIIASQDQAMPMPTTTGPCARLMLPPLRHCKLGPTAILKGMSRLQVTADPLKKDKSDIIANQKPDMPMATTSGPCSRPMLKPVRQCNWGPTATLQGMPRHASHASAAVAQANAAASQAYAVAPQSRAAVFQRPNVMPGRSQVAPMMSSTAWKPSASRSLHLGTQ
ncbi:uncharacterized protein LOC117586139 [Drosophila guanche]|uniref:uncharacterized protein LOC117586139 n=1 Tax=Drosophila guanche TaxID=7266 RepID=UPI001471AB85|nr:uncharacterized protein LOC117586139 [Drosophila guanche]